MAYIYLLELYNIWFGMGGCLAKKKHLLNLFLMISEKSTT